MKTQEYGKWAFLLGVLISVLSAFTTNWVSTSTVVLVLFALGLIAGFLNVDRRNSVTFLMGVLVLLVLGVGGISALSEVRLLGVYSYLATMLGSFIAFVGAAGLVVGIRAILDTNQGLGIIGIGKK
jgi:hypothetical protein